MIDTTRPIAVIAPCGAYDVERFEHGLAIARDRGLDLRPLPGNLQPHRYLAAPDAIRREQLVEAFTSPDYGAVWIARGGYGLTRLLHDLPLDDFEQRPVIGFSDVTALFSVLYKNALGPCIHGPVVHSLPKTDAPSLDVLFALLDGERPSMTGSTWVDGSVTAPIAGGNLCLMAATAGTTQQLDVSGHILVLEEVGEPAYRIDRMLQQCRDAGILDGIAGVALGEFVSCRVPDGASWTLEQMLREHLEPLGIPVLAELPIGHGERNHAFVWGDVATLQGGRLTFV